MQSVDRKSEKEDSQTPGHSWDEEDHSNLVTDRGHQVLDATNIKFERPGPIMCLDSASTLTLFKNCALAKDEKGSGYPTEPDSVPRAEFLDLLRDLWDSTLDMARYSDGELRICHAITAMISFLVVISGSALKDALAIEYPDDLFLVGKISQSLSSRCPDLARELQISLEQLSLGSSRSRIQRSLGKSTHSELRPRLKAPARLRKQQYDKSVVSLVHCVSCGSYIPNSIINIVVLVSMWSRTLPT